MAKKKGENTKAAVPTVFAAEEIEEPSITVEIKEQEPIVKTSLEDELFRDIMSEDNKEEDDYSALLRTPGNVQKKVTGKSKLSPKHIIFLLLAVVVVAGIVLAIVLPGVLANRASNYAVAYLTNGKITMSVNATGALEFYNSTPVPTSFAPDIFVFDETVEIGGKSVKKNRGYRILEVNIKNDVKLLDLIEQTPDFVLMSMLCVNTSGAPWEADGGDMVGKIVELRAGDIITETEEDSSASLAVQALLANAFVSYVNIQVGQTITTTTATLFTVTDYTSARVRFNISAYEVNNIKNAEKESSVPLTVHVSFTSPRGGLEGTLQPLSRNSTDAYADLVIPDSRNAAVNVYNVIGNAQVAVGIQLGSQSGIVAPVYAIFNDGADDYVLMKRSEKSEQLIRVNVEIKYSDGVKAIITSVDERIQSGASVYYEKSDSFLSSLGI
ncbi:MAG: hypothetical protein LBT55_03525 [Clostridiaceae bacterium]|jgi:multidrug efflux pump subunit AcrA (membrane-fusion protein)|nr:hypothetical protein [Clostridiaceae bacterium]